MRDRLTTESPDESGSYIEEISFTGVMNIIETSLMDYLGSIKLAQAVQANQALPGRNRLSVGDKRCCVPVRFRL